MMRSKRGFELSVNFMVTMILAVVIFGLGLAFFGDVFKEATDVKARLDSRTDKQIRDLLLSSGEPVAIPFDRKEVTVKQAGVFGVGIFNVDRKTLTDEDTFQIIMDPTPVGDRQPGTQCKCAPSDYCGSDILNIGSDLRVQGAGLPIKVRKNDQKVGIVSIQLLDKDKAKRGATIICTLAVQIKDVPWRTYPSSNSKYQVYMKVL